MSREENLEAQKKMGQLIVSGQLDRLGEVFADDVVDHDPAPDQGAGVQGIMDFWHTFRTGFPDVNLEPQTIVADEENVAVVLTVTGTHQGTFKGMEPTGRKFSVRGIQVGRFENGKLVERWGATDEATLTDQIRGQSQP